MKTPEEVEQRIKELRIDSIKCDGNAAMDPHLRDGLQFAVEMIITELKWVLE